MGLFRFPHSWSALADRAPALEPIVAVLDDRDRALEDYLALVCPVGKIDAYGGSTAPHGWVLCDGTSYERSAMAALFAAIGTTYGAADATHFNVPDLRQRMPLGKAASGTGSTLGGTGGSKDATAVSHSHTATSTQGIHGHTFGSQSGTSGSPGLVDSLNASSSGTVGISSDSAGPITTTVNAAGSSGTDANLPPYVVVNYIIRF